MLQQDKAKAQAIEILENYQCDLITIEEAEEAYKEIESLLEEEFSIKIRNQLSEYHREEIIKDLPQTD